MSGWRSTSSDLATGKKFLEKLLYVQHVDKEKDTASEISELTLLEHLLAAGRNTFSDLNFTEYSKGNLGILKSSLKDVIVKIKVYSNPLSIPLNLNVTTHAFVVFETFNSSNFKRTWWSFEKNGQYIVLQQSHNKDDVIEKLYNNEKKESVKRLEPVKKLKSAKGTVEAFQNLFVAIWGTKQIKSPYHILFSNCQNFASFFFEKFNKEGEKWSTAISATVDGFKRKSKKTTIEMDDVIKYKSIVTDDKFDYYKAMIEGRRKDFEKILNGLTKDVLNSVDSQGYTLLEWATVFSTSNWPIDEELKKKGAETSQDDGLFRRNVFFIALQYLCPLNEEANSKLSFDRIDINGVNQTGNTALHLALYGRKWDIAEEILNRLEDNDVNVRNSFGDTPLHLAVTCYFDLFKRILGKTNSENVNKTDENGDTALHLAIKFWWETAVKELLQNKAVDVNVKDNNGLTALHLAIRWTNIPVDLFKKILKKSNAINAEDEDGNTALHIAIKRNQVEIIKELLNDDRVNVDVKNNKKETALDLAIWWWNIPAESFKMIIEKSADINAEDEDGRTALNKSISLKLEFVVRELLNHKDVDVNAGDKDNSIAIHYACRWTNIPINLFQLILQKSADCNTKNKFGETALHYALHCKSETAVNELLNHKGVNVNAKNKNDRTALHLTSRWTNIPIGLLKRILQRAEINAIDIDGNTALQFAIINKSEIVAMELLERKDLDVNVKNNKNETALDLALKWKNIPDNLMKILEKSADCNAKNEFEETALQHLNLLDESKTSLEELLLAHKNKDVDVKKNDNQSVLHCVSTSSNIVDTNSVNQMGDTELHLALFNKKWENAKKILVKFQDYDVNVTNIMGYTPLHVAAEGKCGIGLFKRILGKTNSENVNKPDRYGDTALHLAIKTKWKATVKELLQNKDVDVNVKNNDGLTALHLACNWSDFPVHLFQEILQKSTKNNINAINDCGNTALHYAIMKESETAVKELLNDDRVDVNVKDNYNWTALHLASQWSFPIDLFKKILVKSLDVNAIDEDGNTALHFAIMRKSETKVKQLLKDKYIYVNVRNDAGDTALDLASKWKDIPHKLLKIIQEKSEILTS